MKVSVIIPVYNVKPYLEQCVRSVVDQTFKDLDQASELRYIEAYLPPLPYGLMLFLGGSNIIFRMKISK